jgi:hypothetical protein
VGAGDPGDQGRFEVRRLGPLHGAQLFGRLADDDDAVERAEVAAGAGEEVAAHPVEQRATADQLATGAAAEGRQHVFASPDGGEARLRELVGDSAEVDGLAHDADPDQPRPGRAEHVLDRGGRFSGQVAEGDDADASAGQTVAHQRRVDAAGEFVGAGQFLAQFVGPLTRVLEVAGQALLEVPARAGQRVAAELGADQDADGEGEEDRDQRGRVVSGAVTHAGRLDGGRGSRYRPSQILSFSQISWKRSLSAGEVITRIVSRTAKVAMKRTIGPKGELGL